MKALQFYALILQGIVITYLIASCFFFSTSTIISIVLNAWWLCTSGILFSAFPKLKFSSLWIHIIVQSLFFIFTIRLVRFDNSN